MKINKSIAFGAPAREVPLEPRPGAVGGAAAGRDVRPAVDVCVGARVNVSLRGEGWKAIYRKKRKGGFCASGQEEGTLNVQYMCMEHGEMRMLRKHSDAKCFL